MEQAERLLKELKELLENYLFELEGMDAPFYLGEACAYRECLEILTEWERKKFE